MLYQKYRPKDFNKYIGNKEAVETLETYLNKNEVPQAILFSGDTGIGKTTLARILANKLNIDKGDITEINCSLNRGIEIVRQIEEEVQNYPFFGDRKVYIMDEVHQLTNDAQNGLLKVTEDIPHYQYFIFCTTEPKKMKRALKSRFDEINLRPLDDKSLKIIINNVLKSEGKRIHESTANKIIEIANGSARECINLLEKIISIDNEEQALNILKAAELGVDDPEIINLCRSLLKDRMKDFLDIYRKLKIKDTETVRNGVLGYLHSCLSTAHNPQELDKFLRAIDPLKEPTMYSSKAGLLSGLVKSKIELLKKH